MNDILELIKHWGYDNGLHLNSPLLTTTLLLETCADLQRYIIKMNIIGDLEYSVGANSVVIGLHQDIKDCIGYMVITLALISIQNKDLKIDYDSEDYTCLGYQEEVFIISSYISDMQLLINYNEGVQYYINRIINSLRYIAKGYNFTLEDCAKQAFANSTDNLWILLKGGGCF